MLVAVNDPGCFSTVCNHFFFYCFLDGPSNDIAAEFGEIQVTTAFVSVWCILGCEVVDCCSGAKNKLLGWV